MQLAEISFHGVYTEFHKWSSNKKEYLNALMVEDTKFKEECDHVASVCVKACFVCTTCIPVDTTYVFYSVSTCFVCATRICVWIQHMCSYSAQQN